MIVATIISIYSIAGGGFDSELAIAGAKLKFSNPQYLEYASIVVLLFFLWRHWLVSVELRDEFNDHVNRQVPIPNSIVRSIEKLAYGEDVKPFDIISGQHWNTFPEIESASFTEMCFSHFTYSLAHVDDEGRNRTYTYKFSFKSNPNKFLLVNYLYRKSWLKGVLLNTCFGDAILPSIIALVAIATYAINFITR
ncbi:hypothetical protein MM182_00100 [Aeromonas sp. MR19]|uniref:hypothetical protein n=1 Tax=Aeromonas sp. MR19 TaxID=2923421 RepID=UPI001F4AF171|nr:hypothetical protein [Aeromonas sp. MR19]MCH7373796.1 hypothetical protein [Aeromonas sp. MR19]